MFLTHIHDFFWTLETSKKRRGPNVDTVFRMRESGTLSNQNKENHTPTTGKFCTKFTEYVIAHTIRSYLIRF